MIFDIQRASTVDGPGFRTTVFFKGCNLHCTWCHNPESQSFQKELMFYKERCTHCGTCIEVCPKKLITCTLCGECAKYCPQEARVLCGRKYSAEEVMQRIRADRVFYQTTGGGVTFSGGECMLQLDFLTELLKQCRANEIHTAVDTAGHVPFASFEKVLPHTDMFLYDIKLMDSEKHRQYTGVGNELILSNLAKLLKIGKRIWIRVPIVPGINDTVAEMQRIRTFLLENGYPEKVELLPYHRMGESKLAAMNKQGHGFSVPKKGRMETCGRFLRPIWSL